MNSIKSNRFTDKRDEVLIALVVAFIPMVSLTGMVY